ncbi:MAG: helix-turn-helix transcriptional regulator [Clostridia bacterium]|nr:helix-turn-helix transcriptional regulator [Clostridia bacterium]
MTEEQLRKNIAKNITELRKASEITQADLAKQLNYSDKSISKWERGDGVPDVIVLQKIADIFGVTINDIISDEKPKLPRKKPYLTNRIVIPLLSVGLVFLIASIAFFVLRMIDVWVDKSALLFAYAVPIALVVLLIFSEIWWVLTARLITLSGLIWTFFACIRLTVANEDINYIFIIAAILQVITVLWFVMRYRSRIRKKQEERKNKTE